jgi:hypothetical protein
MMKPLIQIDDEVREMTDQEFAEYEAMIGSTSQLNLDTETTQE